MITSGRPGRVLAVSACVLLLLLLTACGDGDESSSEPADTVTETVTESATGSSEPTETATSDDDGGGGSGAAAGLPPKPRRDECVDVTPPRNGRYTVYDAGKAVVRRDGGRLRLGNVDATRGWQARVSDRDDDEVAITFRPRQRGAEFELKVEIDDGRIESEICADDRDD